MHRESIPGMDRQNVGQSGREIWLNSEHPDYDADFIADTVRTGLIVNHTLPKVNENMIDEDIDIIAEENFENIMTIIDEKSDKIKPDAIFLLDYLPMHKRVMGYLDGSSIESLDLEDFKIENT